MTTLLSSNVHQGSLLQRRWTRVYVQSAAPQQHPKRSKEAALGGPRPGSKGSKKAAQGGRSRPSFRAGSPEFLSSAEYRKAGVSYRPWLDVDGKTLLHASPRQVSASVHSAVTVARHCLEDAALLELLKSTQDNVVTVYNRHFSNNGNIDMIPHS